MTRFGSIDRLWVIGGVVGSLLLLVIGYSFFISPQLTETASLNTQNTDAQIRVTALRKDLLDLEKRNNDLPKYEAELATNLLALPTTPASSDFLRDMQAAGDRTGVTITGITVGSPALIVGNATIRALTITLTAGGSTAQLNNFIDQLQQVQPRAVLINSVNLSNAATADGAGAFTVSLSLDAFVDTAGGGD